MIEVKLEDLTLKQICSDSKIAKEAIIMLIDAIAQGCYASGLRSGFSKGKAYGEAHTSPDMKEV